MAGLKIEFSKKNFDRVAQLLASKGSKKHLFPSSALEHSKVCTLSDFGLLQFMVTDFEYPRECRFRKTKQTNQFWSLAAYLPFFKT
jgi:hypothetical protein